MKQLRYTELKQTHRHNLREVIPLKKPYTLLIEPSSQCNFRCRMCFQNAAENDFKDKRHNMDMPLFLRIVKEAKAWTGDKFKVLKLCIYGEPLINKKFSEMLQLAKEYAIAERIETTTNASLLTEEVSRFMIKFSLDYLRVSVYSGLPEKHLYITNSQVTMEMIKSNLARLQHLKKEMGSTKPFVAVKMLDTYSKAENDAFVKAYAEVADEIYLDEPHSWVEIHGENFIDKLYGERIKNVRRNLSPKKACPMPFTTLAIRSDGSVSPCCNDWYGGTNIGSIYEKSLADIWYSQEMLDFCTMQLEGRNQENISCRGCTIYKSNHYMRDNIDSVTATEFKRKWLDLI